MNKKILTAAALTRVLRGQKGPRRVVFTNGCFDLMHLGHVRLLGRAKKLGDVLVVGLNSDGSVRRLKGPRRPLTGQKARAEMLAALRPVDYVVIFNEETPAALIRKLKPDVLIKGGDYRIEDIVGRKDVKKVVRFPLVAGHSTSRLIQKILRTYGHGRTKA